MALSSATPTSTVTKKGAPRGPAACRAVPKSLLDS